LNGVGGGSQVRFGDVQLVPIGGGLMYVRPLFVVVNSQAEYRKIIVSYNSKAVIDDSIGGALHQLFPNLDVDVGDRVATSDEGTDTSTSTPPDDTGGTETTVPGNETVDELLVRAQQLFDEADEALAKTPPDYATYGAKQSEARDLIAKAVKQLEGG